MGSNVGGLDLSQHIGDASALTLIIPEGKLIEVPFYNFALEERVGRTSTFS